MGVAMYEADVALPESCPPKIAFALASDLQCLVERRDTSVQLTLTSPEIPDEWPGDDGPLAQIDDEAHRIVASLCFDYAALFRSPERRSPKDPDGPRTYSFDIRPVTYKDMWPEEELRLTELLQRDDPRRWPLWQTLASVGAFSDPLAKFVALWGLLDIGLGAERVEDIDNYLVNRFGVAQDKPDRHGKPDRETRFAQLRHRVSHPSGRGVDDLTHVAHDAQSLVEELVEYCRTAVQESFRKS